MVDVFTAAKRSEVMSRIRGANTKPEVLVRCLLHRQGFRFRVHAKDLPGKPDIVLPKYKAVVFIHGCFWHGHSCKRAKLPETNRAFWQRKIDSNRKRDEKQRRQLRRLGWRAFTLWQCKLQRHAEVVVGSMGTKIRGRA